MSYSEDKIQEAFKNRQDSNTCEHEWDYMIKSEKDSNLFVEICFKCFTNTGTLELFKD